MFLSQIGMLILLHLLMFSTCLLTIFFFRPRRRSDGNATQLLHHSPSPPPCLQTISMMPQPLSVKLLQNELRSLCVSSPPSLQASPIHMGVFSIGGIGHPTTVSSNSPPAVIPNTATTGLQIISEEIGHSLPTIR